MKIKNTCLLDHNNDKKIQCFQEANSKVFFQLVIFFSVGTLGHIYIYIFIVYLSERVYV